MIQALNLRTDLTMRRKKSNGNATSSSNDKFQFLLFVFDALENRKLTVDSSFYSAVLILGAQDGGLNKRIAYYISEGRRSHKEMNISSEQEMVTNGSAMKWEELLLNYSDFKDEKGADVELLPLVRVSKNDLGRVLAAEQAVSYQPYALKR